MPSDIQTEQGRNEVAHSLAASFQMKEVPLFVATLYDQEIFIPWMAQLLGGQIIRSYDPFPVTKFLESIDHFSYIFLRLEGDIPDYLYLLVRDYALDRESPLHTIWGTYSIHPDHRLAIFIDSTTLARLADDLADIILRVCTMKHVSSNKEGMNRKQPRVFEDIRSTIAWCDRYYSNGRFLFRGQTCDWPLIAPIHRVVEKSEHEREAKRTLNFISWVIGDNALLEGVKLSEDEALAIAQHHGFKTPLLDVSRNARVAAFFATHDANLDENENGVIYIFHEADVKQYMNLDGELGDKYGRGLMEPTIEVLRRIRYQQGLFFESRPWLIQDLVLTKLYFRQQPRGQRIEEDYAPPREFIYPPLTSFELVIESYILVDQAIGTAERESENVIKPPDPSFDSAGFAIRGYLDELNPNHPPPLSSPYVTVDAYSGVLALTCSHLLVHQAHYLTTCLEAGQALRNEQLTPENISEIKKHLYGAHNHMNYGHPTDIKQPSHLSIRDIVDGLAVYHDFRSGNADGTESQFRNLLRTNYNRFISAYDYADHWLGESAWEVFPVAAAFALNCSHPVRAYLDAIIEIGKHEGNFITRYSAEDGARTLAHWTGHEQIPVDQVLKQVPLPIFYQRAIDRLHVWREAHPERVAELGPFLYKQRDMDTIRELSPQFNLLKDFKVSVMRHDTDIAKTVYPLSREISLLEGIVGLESTMRCSLEDCPFHHFRICGRISAIPPDPSSCKQRQNIEDFYKMSPERIEILVKS